MNGYFFGASAVVTKFIFSFRLSITSPPQARPLSFSGLSIAIRAIVGFTTKLSRMLSRRFCTDLFWLPYRIFKNSFIYPSACHYKNFPKG